MRVTVIHNPSSGDARLTSDDLLHVLRHAGHEVLYRSTKADGWRAILDRPADLVVAAGGDGTVDKVGIAMAGRGIPVAILPLGTANNIATALGLSPDVEELIASWAGARVRRLDVGMVRGIPRRNCFVEAVGVGVFPGAMAADMSRPDESEPSLTKLARDLESIFEQLSRERSRHWVVRLDGRDLSGEHLLVEAMNIGTLGPGVCLAADADPSDGLLDVVIVTARERDRLAEHLTRHLRGERPSSPFGVARGRQLLLYGPRADSHVDGKLVREGETSTRTLTLHVGIWPHALDVLV
jgi:diacylglycerol kinase (ATP)